MNINLIKNADGVFTPATNVDYDIASQIKVGTEYNFKYKKIRNPKLHRMYFALINMLFQNQDLMDNKYAFRKWLEVKAGYYDAVITDSGTFFCPKSISYDSLSGDGFNQLFEAVMTVAYEKFAMDNEVIENNLKEFIES